jgi:cytochrome c oxidase subunit 2
MTRVAGLALLAIGAFLLVTGFAPGSAAAPQAASLDGASLFVIKGCAACHDGPGSSSSVDVGPDLGELSAAPAAVRRSIVTPAADIVPGHAGVMPQLSLSEGEIDVLVEFLTGGS